MACNRLRQARIRRECPTQAEHLNVIWKAYSGQCPLCGDEEPTTIFVVDRDSSEPLTPGKIMPICDFCIGELPPVDVLTLYQRKLIDSTALENIVAASIVIEPEMKVYWKRQLANLSSEENGE